MTAARERIVYRARHGEDFAPLLECMPRGRERSAGQRRLHDERAEREAADNSISAREVLRTRRRAHRKLGHERAGAFHASG